VLSYFTDETELECNRDVDGIVIVVGIFENVESPDEELISTEEVNICVDKEVIDGGKVDFVLLDIGMAELDTTISDDDGEIIVAVTDSLSELEESEDIIFDDEGKNVVVKEIVDCLCLVDTEKELDSPRLDDGDNVDSIIVDVDISFDWELEENGGTVDDDKGNDCVSVDVT
jgi:nitrate reductase NapAB chaperone NapD